MQEQAAENQAANNQTAFGNLGHCPYRFPAIVLTHAPKLFLNQASTTTILSRSREVACHDIAGHVPALFAVALENRGPPSLTL